MRASRAIRAALALIGAVALTGCLELTDEGLERELKPTGRLPPGWESQGVDLDRLLAGVDGQAASVLLDPDRASPSVYGRTLPADVLERSGWVLAARLGDADPAAERGDMLIGRIDATTAVAITLPVDSVGTARCLRPDSALTLRF